MKGISEKFDDEEFDFLREKKGDMSWHKFILQVAGYKKRGPIDRQDNSNTTQVENVKPTKEMIATENYKKDILKLHAESVD